MSLHSYRYAWAERAKQAGYPERFAQEAPGSFELRAEVVGMEYLKIGVNSEALF